MAGGGFVPDPARVSDFILPAENRHKLKRRNAICVRERYFKRFNSRANTKSGRRYLKIVRGHRLSSSARERERENEKEVAGGGRGTAIN